VDGCGFVEDRGSLGSSGRDMLEALTGRFDSHHAELARLLLDQVDALSAKVDILTAGIGELLAKMPAAQEPAVGQLPGPEVAAVPRPGPGNSSNANRYLQGVPGEVAAGAARTDTFVGERYRRLVRRRGKQRALAAIPRWILVIVWHLPVDPAARSADRGPS
jgi:transposase